MPDFIAPMNKAGVSVVQDTVSENDVYTGGVVVNPHFAAGSPSGSRTISGSVEINDVVDSDAVVLLIDELTGRPVDFTRSKPDGSFQFDRVKAGLYAMVEIDLAGGYRAKTAHTEVFDELLMVTSGGVLSEAISGIPGKVVSFQIVATGGRTPRTFTLLSGAWPAGLTMNSAGLITGTLTTEAAFTGVVEVQDADANAKTIEFSSVTQSGYRYYRWHFTATNDTTYGGFIGIQEFQLRNAAGSLVSLVGKAVTSSNYYDASHIDTNANNGVTESGQPWATINGTNCWWTVDMGSITPVPSTYHIWVRPTYQAQSPKTWTFLGSNDGTTWDVLDTQTNVTGWTSNQRRDFVLPGKSPAPMTVLVHSHFEGANNATTADDEVAGDWTFFGNAKLTTTSPLVGTSSVLLDGSGDYVKSDVISIAAHQDFCIETFVSWAALANAGIFHLKAGIPSATIGPFALGHNAGAVTIYTDGAVNTFAFAPTLNTKYHAALYRLGGTIYVAAGGTVLGSVPGYSAVALALVELWLGLYYSNGYTHNGRLDETRIVSGNSPYGPANFTPPAGPL